MCDLYETTVTYFFTNTAQGRLPLAVGTDVVVGAKLAALLVIAWQATAARVRVVGAVDFAGHTKAGDLASEDFVDTVLPFLLLRWLRLAGVNRVTVVPRASVAVTTRFGAIGHQEAAMKHRAHNMSIVAMHLKRSHNLCGKLWLDTVSI